LKEPAISPKVTVIGCGVSGLTSAVRLLETGFNVRIIAGDLPPQTTSNAAAAVWYPYRCFPEVKALQWGKQTLDILNQLVGQPESGVFPVTFKEYLPERTPDPWWKCAVSNFRRIHPHVIPSMYKDGYLFEVPLVDTSIYMPWLMGRFKKLGGTVRQKKLNTVEEACTDTDLIINCSGLGARTLVSDPEVFPVRGQGIRVKATNDGSAYLDQHGENSLCYIFPRKNDFILGGTAQENNYQTKPDDSITEKILHKVKRVDPSLRVSEILDTVVGLRPARFEVRLEKELNTWPKPVIHNYGHGGAGFTLSWGCAEEVLKQVKSLVPC
jgi:D-amino-acid oxidase